MDIFDFAMATTPSPTEITCHSFECFWTNCKEWIITWYSTGILDFICGCWALYELVHIYSSIRRIQICSNLAGLNNNSDIFRGRNSKKDDYTLSENLWSSFHSKTGTPSYTHNKSTSPLTSPANSSKIQLFETRNSQKLFCFIIFWEGMLRTFEFIDVPFSFTHCTMTKIDAPNLFYAIISDFAPNLFCYAFSCLGYEMSKIYWNLTKPREHETNERQKCIQRSFHFVVVFSVLITVQSILVNIVFILYFNDKHRYKQLNSLVEAIDFYSYGGFCVVLGLYFIRFAVPIYTLYKEIIMKVSCQQRKEVLIESSISSEQNQDRIQVYKSNGATKKHQTYTFRGNMYQNNSIELQTDALNYFVSSMKRTWAMALYCGLAFIIRAVVLLLFADYMEQHWFVLGPYQFFLEIVPNLMMLYIYHYSTKNMAERYVINR